MMAKQKTTISSTSSTMMHTPYWETPVKIIEIPRNSRTHQRQKTLRLANRPAVAEEAEEEHQSADADEDINALVDQLRLGVSLQVNESRWKSRKFHFQTQRNQQLTSIRNRSRRELLKRVGEVRAVSLNPFEFNCMSCDITFLPVITDAFVLLLEAEKIRISFLEAEKLKVFEIQNIFRGLI